MKYDHVTLLCELHCAFESESIFASQCSPYAVSTDWLHRISPPNCEGRSKSERCQLRFASHSAALLDPPTRHSTIGDHAFLLPPPASGTVCRRMYHRSRLFSLPVFR